MSALKNDNTTVYGSMALTIGGVVYVADNIELTRPTGAVLRTNELGEPSGRVLFKNDVDSFTCTLQFATTSTAVPVLGAACTVTFDSVNGAETWYLDKLGVAYTKDGETKINATLVEDL